MRWFVSVVVLLAGLSACSDGDDGVPDAGLADAAGVDSGAADAGELDAGDLDAGDLDAGSPDAGSPDAGSPDAGTPDAAVARLVLTTGPALAPPTELLDSSSGFSNGVRDASHDFAGNLWAVSSDRLFVRRAGLGAFESCCSGEGLDSDAFLGVGGGLPGIAWVGHLGQGDDDEDPEEMKSSGGVSKVELDGADIRVSHYQLRSPPGRYASYPGGRAKLRSCYRAYVVKVGPHAGDAWFGCNHGVGQVGIDYGVVEHHHPNKCLWDPVRMTCTVKTGYVRAIAFTATGDLWFGGSYGVMQLDYSTGARPGNFWGPEPVRNLSLFPNPLKPNGFGSENVEALAVAADGTLWAASSHSGLAHRFEDGRVDVYQQVDGLPTNELTDLAIDAANGLWLATARDGLWRLDLATGVLGRAEGLSSGLCVRVVVEPTVAGERITAVCRGEVILWNGAPAP